jgi:transposase
MFVKAITARGHVYLKIVKSVRKHGKPTHETIANLGRADRLAEGGLENIITSLQKYVSHTQKSAHDRRKDISTMAETARVNYGYLAYRQLWRQFGLDTLLAELSAARKISYDYVATVFSMVVNHVLNPSSKRSLHEHKAWYAGLNDELALQHLYRSLDLLAEHKAHLETALFDKHRSLFNMSVDVVFFDVTTFYFESQQADTLREFGFGKDGKINEVQVVLALLIDTAGRPISFELFPGNTFEGHTLLSTLDSIKGRFQIHQVIIVADKGLNSKLNLKEIRDRGYDYIVSCRLKNLPQKMKEQVLSACDYHTIPIRELFGVEEDEHKPHTVKYKVLDYTNVVRYKEEEHNKTLKVELREKLICSGSSRRAAKDKADRQRQVEKAEQAIAANHKSILSHRGYKRYIKKGKTETIEDTLTLDQDKIAAEARFDGYAAIQCSRLDCGAVEVMRAYRQLLKIEESFRVMKSTLRARPVFVWTPEHVKGHFVMCFLAFALERELEYRLNTRRIENSPDQIKSALRSMQCSELDIEHELYYLRGTHQPLASHIFAVLKMKQPINIMNKHQWGDYLKNVCH